MENATRALLIAGTVLIAIIIVCIALYLYTVFSNQSKEYNETISAIELEKFNSKFEVYVGRTDVKAQEIVSVVNLANEQNHQVQIYIQNTLIVFTPAYTQESFIKENQEDLFSCVLNVSEYNPNPEYQNGKIIKLRFIKN